MIKNYIAALIELFPNISSGRKNFDFFDKRIKKNIKLTKIYTNKKTIKVLK
tara:strand:+ start:1617 stop:1769 length:153 start_codon:yes stop_codon:yes gene_type:complete